MGLYRRLLLANHRYAHLLAEIHSKTTAKPGSATMDHILRTKHWQKLAHSSAAQIKAHAFISGLKPSLRMHVTNRKLDTNFQQILEWALIAEVSAPTTMDNQILIKAIT